MRKLLLFIFLLIVPFQSTANSEENIYKNIVVFNIDSFRPYQYAQYFPKTQSWKICKIEPDDNFSCFTHSEEDFKVVVKEGYYEAKNGIVRFYNSLLYSVIYSETFK